MDIFNKFILVGIIRKKLHIFFSLLFAVENQMHRSYWFGSNTVIETIALDFLLSGWWFHFLYACILYTNSFRKMNINFNRIRILQPLFMSQSYGRFFFDLSVSFLLIDTTCWNSYASFSKCEYQYHVRLWSKNFADYRACSFILFRGCCASLSSRLKSFW